MNKKQIFPSNTIIISEIKNGYFVETEKGNYAFDYGSLIDFSAEIEDLYQSIASYIYEVSKDPDAVERTKSTTKYKITIEEIE